MYRDLNLIRAPIKEQMDVLALVPHFFRGKVDYAADEIVPDNNLSDFFPVIGLLAQHKADRLQSQLDCSRRICHGPHFY